MKANVFVVNDLVNGDGGKGETVDYLTRKYGATLVCRYNGASQAGHNVVAPDGRHHCFAQFGSGTLVPGVRTFLSSYMAVEPLCMISESAHLQQLGVDDALARMNIDPDCLVITPFHWRMNRIQESARGGKRHGSCGRGVGEVFKDHEVLGEKALRIKDLSDRATLRTKLRLLQADKIEKANQLAQQNPHNQTIQKLYNEMMRNGYVDDLTDAYLNFYYRSGVHFTDAEIIRQTIERNETVIFEGAQGALLDQDYGFWPHVTYSKTTSHNAYQILNDLAMDITPIKVGVMRGFMTRHGAGPFVTEDPEVPEIFHKGEHNEQHEWQGNFRYGWFDLVMARYALEIVGTVDWLALTCLDRFDGLSRVKVATGYKCKGSYQKLDRLFRLHGCGDTWVHSIKPFRTDSEKYRKELTTTIASCQPIYENVKVEDRRRKTGPFPARLYVEKLEEQLGQQFRLLSFGPTANETYEK